jgi:hypothetical protein
MSTTTSAAHDPTLPARVERAAREIHALRSQTDRGTVLTFLVGILAIGALGLYFWYGYRQLSEFTRPDDLANLGQQLMDANLPDARAQAEAQIIKSAPDWAASLSREAIAAVPGTRQWLVDHIKTRIDEGLDRTELISDRELRRFLRANQVLIERDLQDLADTAELSEARLDELVAAIEEHLGTDLKAHSEELLGAINGLDEKLARLASATDLTPAEQSERRILMLARRIQAEHIGSLPPRLEREGSTTAAVGTRMPVLPDQAPTAAEAAETTTEVPKTEAAPRTDEAAPVAEAPRRPAGATPKAAETAKPGDDAPKGAETPKPES